MSRPAVGARSFAGVTYEEAMHRARTLVPVLRRRAEGAEAGGEMPHETIQPSPLTKSR